MDILFINSTMRDEKISRTYKLAKVFLDSCIKCTDTQIREIKLKNLNLLPLSAADTELRDDLVKKRDFSNDRLRYAIEFASADKIIIAAPYWDLSFPALLKIYFENIFVNGITFSYTEEGRPESLCKAKKLVYITTSGGFIGENSFGEDYIRGICKMFSISDFKAITAEGLDIVELSENEIMEQAEKKAADIARNW